MSTKALVMIGMTVGSLIGSYVPVIFGVSAFSFTSIVTGAIGGFIGIWIGFKLGNS
ncbi:hypothetical protein HY025_04415 [Candidatus Daviesbacteria bacterium]|nr:hypothetical protein [Candidatus Daviesbacteria bacterium]